MSRLRTHWLTFIAGLSMAVAASCTGQVRPILEGVSASREATTTSPAIDTQTPEADPGQIAAGREIAVRECSACHALDADSTSPRPAAPPLKAVLWRYDEDALATHLIEGIRVGHADMPLFDFNVIGADALIAYLRSIRAPREERSQLNR
jgi:mono/diheme cytochrome c family protein